MNKPSDGLNTPIQYLKGIGPKRASALKSAGVETVRDLLYYFPRDYLDLSTVVPIAHLRSYNEQYVSIVGAVKSFDVIGRLPRQRFELRLGDATGVMPLVFFRSLQYYRDAFTVGETIAVSGKVTMFRNKPQMVHPSIDRLSTDTDDEEGKEGFLHTSGIVPKYSSSEDLRTVHLDTKGFRRILKSAVDQYIEFVNEFLPQGLKERLTLLPLKDALRTIHFPESHASLENSRRRLKFDELFLLQLLLALRKTKYHIEQPGIAFNVESKLARKLVDSLPFKLTKAQVRVIKEIAEDMKPSKPMNRLLQGDVGSGKTIVALLAMLIAIENGYQTAFMAPTEILAEQHFRTMAKLLNNLPVNIRLLVGGQSKRLREDVLEDIRRGTANIVVGTHALIEEGVDFANLGFIVIDEQHRFGVSQRLALKEKGIQSHGQIVHPDILIMTATPIPRTLSLTLYGDLDVSTIDELPKNRRPIKTILKIETQRQSVYKFIREEVQNGRQVYVVYPLIEESEKLDLKAATEGYEHLRKEVFADLKIGLLHGRMSSDEKDKVMESFVTGEINILVATTVIEVGIDVSTASVMVIEHAERFGLSQLHQLRGRVGRGVEQSYCILMAPNWMSNLVKRSSQVTMIDGEETERAKVERRLATMVETTNGFKIAEIDLELRGPGDFWGTRQSGLPELHIANLLTDNEILTLARREAFNLITNDPHLRHPDHQTLRTYFRERMKDTLALIDVG
jgi:ATP-dependent DNA helicase RecG